MTTKICVKCKKSKELSFFHKNKWTKDGCSSWCKECKREYGRSDKSIKKLKEWQSNNKDKIKLFGLRSKLKKYNLTEQEFLNLKIKQNNSCGICFRFFDDKTQVCIDHDHETNKVRGLLCINCNTALGSFKDNITILNNAIRYLTK